MELNSNGCGVSTVLPGGIQMTNQLFYFLDQLNYEGLVGQCQAETRRGRHQIMQATLKKPVTQRVCHVPP